MQARTEDSVYPRHQVEPYSTVHKLVTYFISIIEDMVYAAYCRAL